MLLLLLFLPSLLCSRPYPLQVHRAVKELLPSMAASAQGAWASWSSWSPCSVSCGEGVRVQRRRCRDQKTLCRGIGTRLQVCHELPCSSGSSSDLSGRDSQCRAMGAKWRSSNLPPSLASSCTLFCHKQGSQGPPVAWGSVRDGTPCYNSTPSQNPVSSSFSSMSNICLGGNCKVSFSSLAKPPHT